MSLLVPLAYNLKETLFPIVFRGKVSYTYHTTHYAWLPHQKYLSLYANSPKKIIFWGINPGPWGMAQTGIPFGEINAVTTWLKINEHVDSPNITHPKKPITGFLTKKSEISGKRLWGLFQQQFSTVHDFFNNHFVTNYCPLLFLDVNGTNLTPDKLLPHEQKLLFSHCDQHMRDVTLALQASVVIAVGNFIYKRATDALASLNLKILKIPHPSPANPTANKNWNSLVIHQLKSASVW